MPLSRNQIKKLGHRLRDTIPPSDEDLALYLEMCSSLYQGLLDTSVEIAQNLGLSVVTRFKTSRTLIEKLQRSPNITLGYINDVAGMRIVVDGGRIEQDEIVSQLVDNLRAVGGTTRIMDRREEPSFGYRAVHVIVKLDGVLVEIQVRTEFQDLWANVMEKFADVFGRQVRYGDEPDNPDAPLHSDFDMTPRMAYERILEFAENVSSLERLAVAYESLPEPFVFSDDLDYGDLSEEEVEYLRGQDLGDVIKEGEEAVEKTLNGMMKAFESLGV